jgi:hypothetical protein
MHVKVAISWDLTDCDPEHEQAATGVLEDETNLFVARVHKRLEDAGVPLHSVTLADEPAQ